MGSSTERGQGVTTMVGGASRHRVARLGVVLAISVGVGGCAGAFELDAPEATGPPPPAGFTGCDAESYDFIGEGTLAGLGLDEATPVPPPDPNRVAMIWVTHDLLPYDSGPPGGEVEMTRMLCFEFDDGSGGSEWPVEATWRAPDSADPISDGDDAGMSTSTIIMVALATLLVAVVSAVAFWRRPGERG